MKHTHLKASTIVLAAVALVVGVSSGAVAGRLITGADVKNGSLTGRDIQNGSLAGRDIKNGTVRVDDLSAAAQKSLRTSYAGPNWSVIDRNVIGAGDAFLRAGPTVGTADDERPPLGIGSLGLHTTGAPDKVAFGDDVDFDGTQFSDVSAIGFSLFATQRDFQGAATNAPSISFELDFDPAGAPDPHTVSYRPNIGADDVDHWTTENALTDPDAHWRITGIGMGTLCDFNGTPCTFADVTAYLTAHAPNAVIRTVEFTKGDGEPGFSGAVDALRINNDVYDFEPFGVTVTHQ